MGKCENAGWHNNGKESFEILKVLKKLCPGGPGGTSRSRCKMLVGVIGQTGNSQKGMKTIFGG